MADAIYRALKSRSPLGSTIIATAVRQSRESGPASREAATVPARMEDELRILYGYLDAAAKAMAAARSPR
jgi:hypothetical protein